uniref:Uncharacterized protein n=1 Tax=Kwoniella bestiolae CBS 10118 TaxID=1296100 RepID=A0A1B9GF59_9TREE|nr:hypothetical protein I302_01194 [Kwoniella bestiolae CBS 10118]OCF29682.1 hypothetical protein I302_01194 [Kwoniella bestiolae CBS 10118]
MRLTAPPRPTSLSSLFILPVPLGLLVIAYLVAISRRPDVPESVQVDDHDHPDIPTALSLLSSLTSSNRFNVTTLSPFSPQWNIELSSKQNLKDIGCDDVDWVWRVGDQSGSEDLGCEKAIWVEEGVEKPGGANVSLLSQPHHMLKPQHSHNALQAAHGEGWELGLLTHALPAAE